MNRLILSGFIATEPDMRYTSTGKAVIHFSVSVRKGTKKSNTEGSAASAKTYDVNFFNVEAWGAVAEYRNDRITKGSFVTLEGRLDNDVFEQDGKRRTRAKVIAERIEVPYVGNDSEAAKRESSEHPEGISEAKIYSDPYAPDVPDEEIPF